MTKLQMTDSILFALDQLGKARHELARIQGIDIEKHPFPGPVFMGEAVAFHFGRAEGIANNAEMWLSFAIKSLEQCVISEFAALTDQHGTEGAGRTNK